MVLLTYLILVIGFTSIYNSQILPLVEKGLIQVYNNTTASYQELGLNQASTIWGYSPKNPSLLYIHSQTTVLSTTSSTIISTTSTGNESLPGIGFIEQIGSIFLGLGAISFIGLIVFQYTQFRKNMFKVGSNKTSFRNFLQGLKKTKDIKKTNHNIDQSLQTIDDILNESQK